MSETAVLVVNAALQMIAAQKTIASLTDGSAAANAASVVYAPTVQLMLRELDPDFARLTAALTIQTGGTNPLPWAYEYAYPADCIRVRQVRPPASGTGALADVNNPSPVRSNVAIDLISGVPTKVILTNQQNALAVYTSSSVAEAQWDAAFTDTLIRRLANPLAMALTGRPDFATALLEQAARMASTCETIDESSVRRRM